MVPWSIFRRTSQLLEIYRAKLPGQKPQILLIGYRPRTTGSTTVCIKERRLFLLEAIIIAGDLCKTCSRLYFDSMSPLSALLLMLAVGVLQAEARKIEPEFGMRNAPIIIYYIFGRT